MLHRRRRTPALGVPIAVVFGVLMLMLSVPASASTQTEVVVVPAGVPAGTPATPLPAAREAVFTRSGIHVHAGETFTMTATGLVRGYPGGPQVGPDGIPMGLSPEYGLELADPGNLIAWFPQLQWSPSTFRGHYGLIGSIVGPTSNDVAFTGGLELFFAVGSGHTVTAWKSGELAFTVNEPLYRPGAWLDHYVNNEGAFEVTVTARAPQVSLESGPYAEGDAGTTPVGGTVALDRPARETVTVRWQTETATPADLEGTGYLAASPDDYAVESGVVTIPRGSRTAPFTMHVTGDTRFEPTERFAVRAAEITGADRGIFGARTIVEISNDDPFPQLLTAERVLAEGDSSAAASVTLRLDRFTDIPMSVDVSTIAGTAREGEDFEAIPDSSAPIAIPPGSDRVAVPLVVNGDTVYEFPQFEGLSLRAEVSIDGFVVQRADIPVSIGDDELPPIVGLCGPPPVITEGGPGETNPMEFTVCANDVARRQGISVEWATSDATAEAGSDYVGSSGTITLPLGAASATVSVPVSGDAVNEPDETLSVTLGNPGGAILGLRTQEGTIADDDQPPVDGVAIGDASVTEGTGTGSTVLVFPVTRSGPLTAGTLTWTATGITAMEGSDWTQNADPARRTVRLAAGQAEASIRVPVRRDSIDEPDETLRVVVSSPTLILTDSEADGAIVDDDDPASASVVSIEDAEVVEGTGAGTTRVTFRVTRTGSLQQPGTILWTAESGTALEGSDWTQNVDPARRLVRLAAGQSEAAVAVTIRRDALDEPDEWLGITITSPEFTVDRNQATGTVIDDDPIPAASITDATVVEGDTGTRSVTLRVTLANASQDETVTLGWETADGTATAPDDLRAASGTVSIPPGARTASIRVLTVGDRLSEGTETFEVVLKEPVNAVLADDRATVTITDNEPAP